MNHAEKRVFSSIGRSPEHQPFRDWIEKERTQARDRLETLRDTQAVYAMQGRAQLLKEIQALMCAAFD